MSNEYYHDPVSKCGQWDLNPQGSKRFKQTSGVCLFHLRIIKPVNRRDVNPAPCVFVSAAHPGHRSPTATLGARFH